MSQRKVIQINHALSGVHGKQLKSSAQKITQTRKQILKRLQRKKKLASVIQDQLYWYLERYPEQKQGLHQESTKKKKSKVVQDQDDSNRLTYQCPKVQVVRDMYLLKDENSREKVEKKFRNWFSHEVQTEMQEEKTQ